MRVRLLGGLEIEGIETARLGSRKARSLVKRLALARGRAVPADQLVDALWGDKPPARPNDQLAVLVSRLRGVLGADKLVRDDIGYRLVADWLDADALAELVEEANRRLTAGETGAARAAAGAALAVARGPLLPDELDAEWAEADRHRAERLTAQARAVTAEAALAAGDVAAAIESAGVALDHDPYDEAALRVQMRALAAGGRPASALAAYARSRKRLGEDLGIDPSPETEALHTSLLLGDTQTGAAPAQPGVDVGLPGRADALAALDDALGRGGLVGVDGEAGMGKTRLLDVWATRAASRGASVLRGRFEELGRGLPMHAVMDALAIHIRGLEPGDADALLGPEGEVLGPQLGRSATAPATVGALVDQAAGRGLLFGALHAVLGRMGGGGPVALLLDDAHLAGPLTFEWLHFLARRGVPPGVLVVVARRPEEGEPLPGVQRITLGPLGLDATAEVVGRERASDLHARSGGHPLFLVELAASRGDALPASVRDAVAARCDRAGEAADTLRAAAVLGGEVDLDLLAAAVGRPPIELLGHLEEGVRRRLLVEEGNGFAFAHALLRDALAAGTSPSRRTLLHRAAGRALAARARPDPRAVAHHALLGGDHETAAAALADAAIVAVDGYDQREAANLVEEALGLVDSPHSRLVRARVRVVGGDYAGAVEDARAAQRMGAGAEALELAAWGAHFLKDDATAIALGEEGALLADDANVRASCLTISGWARMTRGEVVAADAQLTQAHAMATGPARTMAATWLGAVRVFEGETDEGMQLLGPLVTMGIGTWHSQPLTYAHMMRAIGLGYQGRPTDALAAVHAFEEEVARTGSPRFGGRAANIRGWILRGVGESAEADDSNRLALDVAAARGLIEPLSHAHLDLAAGALAAADFGAAVEHLDAVEAVQHLPHSLGWRHRLRSRLLRARLAMADSTWDTAEEEAAEATRVATEVRAARQVAMAELLVAEIRLRRGDPVDREAVDRLLQRLPELAGLEAWWITADLADAARVGAWRALAEQRVRELGARAGPHRAALEAMATRRFEP